MVGLKNWTKDNRKQKAVNIQRKTDFPKTWKAIAEDQFSKHCGSLGAIIKKLGVLQDFYTVYKLVINQTIWLMTE